MNRRRNSLCGLITSIAMTAAGLAAGAPVVSISDGDTLTVLESGNKQVKIRLAYVDAPEKRQNYGARARESLASLCYGKDASYRVVDVDRYGRSVALVTCGGVQVNQAQVERGYAWAYRRYNPDPAIDRLEQAARAAKNGLWADAAPVPPWEFRRR